MEETQESIDKKLKQQYYLVSRTTNDRIIINGIQLDLLEIIANTETDACFNKVYIINDLKFNLSPKLD